MRKFESIQYMKSLGLPVCLCKEFTHNQLDEMLSFANYLRQHGYGCGLRSDYTERREAGTGCPFFMNIRDDLIEYLVDKYQDRLTYIISECTPTYTVENQGVAVLLPNRELFIATNPYDRVSCRVAIENPSSDAYVLYHRHDWNSYRLHKRIRILRNYIIRASICDDNVVGKRIEWSWFTDRGLIFWQMSDDSSFIQCINYTQP